MHAHDQSSIFSTGGKFRPDYGLLLELHTLTLVACSYVLLSLDMNSFWYSLNPRFPTARQGKTSPLLQQDNREHGGNYSPLLHDVIVFSFVPVDMKLRIRLTQQPTADSSPITSQRLRKQ